MKRHVKSSVELQFVFETAAVHQYKVRYDHLLRFFMVDFPDGMLLLCPKYRRERYYKMFDSMFESWKDVLQIEVASFVETSQK